MRNSSRRGAVLFGAVSFGAVLAAASLSAGGTAAGAVSSGHATARAAVMGLVRHQGIGSWPWLGRGLARPAPLPGVANVPKPGMGSGLASVFCTSSTNCLAVGFYNPASGDLGLNDALHWNGKAWSKVSIPSPGGTHAGDFSELQAVRCVTAKDCWAVGAYGKGGAQLQQALHWNGKTWSKFPTPTPGGTLVDDLNQLFDVVCTSATNCWAAGEYGNGADNNETILNELLHWNGRKWSQVHTPNPAGVATNDGNGLSSVRCTSAKNCLAVGTYGSISEPSILHNESLRWNGKTWSKLTTPDPGLTTKDGDFNILAVVTCASSTECWAAGRDGMSGSPGISLNEVLRWNGTKWSVATIPQPDGTGSGASNELLGATCTSGHNCWAVGSYGSLIGSGKILNQALRWDGTKWSKVSIPNPAGTGTNASNALNSIRCASASNCWTVGESEKPSGNGFNTALRWNGHTWSTG